MTGPLSVVGDYVGTVRRSGVIIAMSSGLVATMALPANAVTSSPVEVSGPQTAGMPAVPGGSSTFFAAPEGGLLSMPEGLALEDGTVAAPAAATLDFDHTAFVAVATQDPDSPSGPTGAARRGDLQLDDLGDAGRASSAPATRREARRSAQTTPAVAKKSTTSNGKASTADDADTAAVPASASRSAAVTIASRYLGVRYRFGGAGPNGFDCSGLVQYVYRQLGKSLPRTAAEQASATRRVSRSQARPGDLVLFPGGGHIGIYVGNGMMLDAPHTGTVVQIRKIYSSNVSFGRVV